MYAISERFPESQNLSHYQIKKRISQLTSISPLVHNMNPMETRRYLAKRFARSHWVSSCRRCGGIPRPQKLFATEYNAHKRSWTHHNMMMVASIYVKVYEDFLCGLEYLEAFLAGRIDEHNTTLLLSLDSAQLYEKKVSDCWIYIWILFDFHPELRYKKSVAFISGIFPGPLKPKHFDSLLYPGIHHLSALQREGFQVWDAYDGQVYTSNPFLNNRTVDNPGVVYMNGLTGHTVYQRSLKHCWSLKRLNKKTVKPHPLVSKCYQGPEGAHRHYSKNCRPDLRSIACPTSQTLYYFCLIWVMTTFATNSNTL